jgi:hypothetical protein
MAPMIPSVSQSGQSSFTWAGVSTSTLMPIVSATPL